MTVKCTPKKKNKNHLYLSALFSAGLVASVIFVSLKIGNALAFQLLAVAFSASLIWALLKFQLTDRTYTLTDHYGPMMFIITQTQGKRTSTVFETRIDAIKDVGEISPGSDNRIPSGVFYDFRATFGATEYQYIVTRILDKNITVRIEADPDFWKIFTDTYRNALEAALTDGEDVEEYDDEDDES